MKNIVKHQYSSRSLPNHKYANPNSVTIRGQKSKDNNTVEIFQCVLKNEQQPLLLNGSVSYEQGIIYQNGQCRIGIDLWRDLKKNDCSSHDTQKYNSFDIVKKKYWIIPIDGKLTKGAKLQC